MENNIDNDEITLTREQQNIVEHDGSEILIRGIAGSGKTLVLLKKAKQTAIKYPEDKVVIFTYAGTLSNATKILIERYGIKNLEVKTFHSWAMSTYFSVMKRKVYLTKGKSQEVFLKKAIKKLSNLKTPICKK